MERTQSRQRNLRIPEGARNREATIINSCVCVVFKSIGFAYSSIAFSSISYLDCKEKQPSCLPDDGGGGGSGGRGW